LKHQLIRNVTTEQGEFILRHYGERAYATWLALGGGAP
jgi:hypothetical protein